MMPIPESQLKTWSHQGAVAQSRDTYAIVKSALEAARSPYSNRGFESFLQGSYANDTNVFRDSDVDVVMRLDSSWYHDANSLPNDQYQAFERAYPGSAEYGVLDFKAEVARWLAATFDGVTVGTKAIRISGRGSRRDCDVLACARFKHYYRFLSPLDERYADGICFFLKDGTRILNFPRQHSANCTDKHQATNQLFKPVLRIYKNIRNHLMDAGVLSEGVAPSYFIEGMLWNVPVECFARSYEDSIVATFNHLVSADRTTFSCANGIHPLLEENSHVSWSPVGCQIYLRALKDLWDNW